MAKSKSSYKCKSCGSTFSKWSGQCPQCKEWNTLEEYKETQIQKQVKLSGSGKYVRMGDVVITSNNRVCSGIEEFDRVVGGGLVEDSITLLAAPPGTGKSTLCLSLCDKMIGIGKKVLYASGEESASQLKARADRMELDNSDSIYLSESSCMDDVVASVEELSPDLLIVDSIQTFYLNGFLPSRAGNPTQVIECASTLQAVAKRFGKPCMVVLIGQMTKEDEIAGQRALEHLVDTVLIMDGNRDDTFRMLFANKNRFGNTGEVGFFQMTAKGLLSVTNPSSHFLTERTAPVMGTSLTVLKEGSRPIVIEIESLVTKTYTSFPSRISEVVGKDRLNVLISILEQHCGMNFFDKNVVVNTQNNIKLKSGDTNLATLATIASSYYKKPLPLNYVFLADVGLTGELKKVPNIEMRLKELDRMGYDNVYISRHSDVSDAFKHLSIKRFDFIIDVLKDLGLKS